MQLNITGHHIEITPSLSNYIKEKTKRLTRHFDQVLNINVTLEVQKLQHKAEASVHVSGNQLFANAVDEDMYAAIDSLADKLDRQILKHKEKITRKHRQEGSHRNIVVE
ncbi:MAG: ribosomal subunit interface protein [Proteobacteria bacterium]|nr:MAG: ribosomal subunit interface protein [Pseudomonadota bacterium]